MQAIFQSCISLVDKIPASFWGVVVGSLFTLTGIYFTNRASENRLELQLQSDRELKNREREMALRKEIYVAAAKAITVSMTALPKLSDLSFSLKEVSAIYTEQSSVIAQVNLVAGEETFKGLTGFGLAFGGAFLRLAPQRMALDILQEQIAVKVALVKSFEKTRDAMIELMRHHNIEGIQDARRFAALQENFDFEATSIAMTYEEIQQMTAQLVAKHTPFAMECMAESKRINEPLVPLLLAARRELELSTSDANYAEILSQIYPKLEGDMAEFIQKVSDARAQSL